MKDRFPYALKLSDEDSSLEQRALVIQRKLNDLLSHLSQVVQVVWADDHLIAWPSIPKEEPSDDEPIHYDALDFAKLPLHLRMTLRILQSKGQGTAIEVADATGNDVSVENDRLNQLHLLGLVGKKQNKRSAIFHVAIANGTK
ncbi:MAG: hypothetical protein ACFFB3_08450 [Candidatus Hodarchaeota archaeon]